MPKFSENRKYLFKRTSPVTPLLVNNSINNKRNWIQKLVKTSNDSYSRTDTDVQKTSENLSQFNYEKCCQFNHISQYSLEQKNSILNYFNSISCDNNMANEYLKRHVIPVPIKRKRISENNFNKPKSSYFEYFVEVNNERKKVCKKAFLSLHQIKKSRLERKIQHKRQETHDMRGLHDNRWNQLLQEVVDDIMDFISDLPARESHYSGKTLRNRKYLSSGLNVSKLHKNFLKLYSEYEKVVSYEFFNHYFKKFNIGLVSLVLTFALNVNFSMLKLNL